MLPVDRWIVYYGDGSTFSSADGSWAEAPPFGVFAIVYYRVGPKGVSRLVQMEQHDRSVFRWPDSLPPPDGAVEILGPEATGVPCKYGLWIANGEYFALFDRVHGEIMPGEELEG